MNYNSLEDVKRERQRLEKEVGEHTFNRGDWKDSDYLAQCRELYFLIDREDHLSHPDNKKKQRNKAVARNRNHRTSVVRNRTTYVFNHVPAQSFVAVLADEVVKLGKPIATWVGEGEWVDLDADKVSVSADEVRIKIPRDTASTVRKTAKMFLGLHGIKIHLTLSWISNPYLPLIARDSIAGTTADVDLANLTEGAGGETQKEANISNVARTTGKNIEENRGHHHSVPNSPDRHTTPFPGQPSTPMDRST